MRTFMLVTVAALSLSACQTADSSSAMKQPELYLQLTNQICQDGTMSLTPTKPSAAKGVRTNVLTFPVTQDEYNTLPGDPKGQSDFLTLHKYIVDLNCNTLRRSAEASATSY